MLYAHAARTYVAWARSLKRQLIKEDILDISLERVPEGKFSYLYASAHRFAPFYHSRRRPVSPPVRVHG